MLYRKNIVVCSFFAIIVQFFGLTLLAPEDGLSGFSAKSSPGGIPPERGQQRSRSPKRSESPKTVEPISRVEVSVLQQKTDVPFTWHGSNLETSGDGTVVGDPGLMWTDVRKYDGTNCGYHALKNIDLLIGALRKNGSRFVADELSKPNSILKQQLTGQESLISGLADWSNKIYQVRKENIYTKLETMLEEEVKNGRQNGDLYRELKNILDTKSEDNSVALKDFRSRFPHERMRSYVNANNGHIKVDDLSGREIERLVEHDEGDLQNHVIVVDYIPGMPFDEMLSDPVKSKIENFNKSTRDTLGIVWNEDGLNHWVGVVMHKENGKVVMYVMNSIPGKKPQYIQQLESLFTPSTT
jgi:hypothetical protein